MLSTGCSGSEFSFRGCIHEPLLRICAANAVRYGTGKAEWFLNAVSSNSNTYRSVKIDFSARPSYCPPERLLRRAADLESRLLVSIRQNCSLELRAL